MLRDSAVVPVPKFDIAFVGSGIACSMTLLEMAERLACRSPATTLRIAVVERDEQFWCGIAYGRRSSIRSLAIQKLDEFVSGAEKDAYCAWLERHKDNWLTFLRAEGGEAAARWLDDNREALEQNRWGWLYLPRFLFGQFISQQMADIIKDLAGRGLAEIETVSAEAVSADSIDGRFVIGLCPSSDRGPTEICADRLVVAIGSPPTKSLLVGDHEPAFTYINDFYDPDGESNVQRLRQALQGVSVREQRNVLVVGSNATSLEALYLMRHDPAIRERIGSVTVISRSGVLPYLICDQPPEFDFPRLTALLRARTVTAIDVMAAMRADLALAAERSLNLADLYDNVDALIGQAFRRMDQEQLAEFYWVHGMTYTRLVRRAGRDCRQAATELAADGTLSLLAGEVIGVKPCASGGPFARLHYRVDGSEQMHPEQFAAVVNCGGFEELDACSAPFLASVLRNGLCRPNRTNRGVLVNDEFEASPGFFVIGPLNGGNFTPRIRFWHVESAPRIRALAKLLADGLVSSMPPAQIERVG
ncbi:hypothetical protein A9W97_14725 [Mycobacterium gordonae]|nr:FAD/NAD(P)-binding protein [Mycobacterium gordonae]OBJ89211.1 hypothetical protein A9W97_14725 [Mycobacterium gordonae]